MVIARTKIITSIRGGGGRHFQVGRDAFRRGATGSPRNIFQPVGSAVIIRAKLDSDQSTSNGKPRAQKIISRVLSTPA